ncbi:hypothetical protein EVAR_32602_1 [Eumeta japonica]|uniref:Uncharacterized protein n=1 Tax=Eumeta variegata TaxID=151549 RepID=A0A4C1WJM0_EUMVA|nr:hypothetical protein EVAR_32602_1 [Eumeta japonica]
MMTCDKSRIREQDHASFRRGVVKITYTTLNGSNFTAACIFSNEICKSPAYKSMNNEWVPLPRTGAPRAPATVKAFEVKMIPCKVNNARYPMIIHLKGATSLAHYLRPPHVSPPCPPARTRLTQ